MGDSDQIRMFAAKGAADTAMKQAKIQVIEDMEAMRQTVKRLTDNTDMKKFLDRLSGVATNGAKRIQGHMASERTQIALQGAAQQLDARLHQEIGRFLNGSMSASAVSAKSLAQSIVDTISIPTDIAKDMGETLCEFVSEIWTQLKNATIGFAKKIKIWWYLQEKFEESMNMGLVTFDSMIENSPCQIPGITREYREELKKVIGEIHYDYSKCYNGMGLKLFGNGMVLTCVYTAGISATVAVAGGLSAVATSFMGESSAVGLLGETLPILSGAAPVACYVAVGAIILALGIGGIMWFFGSDNQAQLEKDLERHTRLIRRTD